MNIYSVRTKRDKLDLTYFYSSKEKMLKAVKGDIEINTVIDFDKNKAIIDEYAKDHLMHQLENIINDKKSGYPYMHLSAVLTGGEYLTITTTKIMVY